MAVIEFEYEDEEEVNESPPDKVKAVANGVREKKGPLKRLKESIFAAGPKEVKESIIKDVVLPSLKDFFADTLYTIVDVAIYGRGGGRVTRGRKGRGRSSGGVIDYNKESTRKRDRDRDSGRRSTGYSLDNIFFPTREEADQVFDALVEELDDKGEVSVYYFYELAGITAAYTDQAWGWTSLEGTGYVRNEDGYALALPKPKLLNK